VSSPTVSRIRKLRGGGGGGGGGGEEEEEEEEEEKRPRPYKRAVEPNKE
jgi:hypothetical protein